MSDSTALLREAQAIARAGLRAFHAEPGPKATSRFSEDQIRRQKALLAQAKTRAELGKTRAPWERKV